MTTNDNDHRGLLPAGLADLLPPDAAREARAIDVAIERFAAFGYERVKPPLVEFEESLLGGPGAALGSQTFRLMDPVSQRMMGVRPDMTVQVARIAVTRLKHEPRPLRLSYGGNVIRVRGSALKHVDASAADIVSDAVTPGAIQVPANGLPIVLLADSQTVGGYPKIATVISADLPRLAHLKPGTRLRFQAVGLAEARLALQAQLSDWKRWLATRETFVPAGFIDLDALYSHNLISGALRAEA